MRFALLSCALLIGASVFGQAPGYLEGSPEAVNAMIRSATSKTALRQYTRATMDHHLSELGKYNLPPDYPTLQLNSLSKVGHIGRLDVDRVDYWVAQHIEEGVLVDVEFYGMGPSRVSRFLFKNAPALKDAPTGGLADVSGVWQITGTFKYPTIRDPNHTTLVVEPLPEDEVKLPARSPHRYLMNLDNPSRQWSLKDGTPLVRGIYLGYKESKVWIMNAESEVVIRKLFDLSTDDQKFVRGEIKQGRRAFLIPEYEREIMGIGVDQE